MKSVRVPGWLFSLVAFLLVTLAKPTVAHAYVWMLRYGDATCTSCHTDPSGSVILTAKGRSRGDLLTRTRYTSSDFQLSSERHDEPSPLGGFAWGGGELPDEIRFGADLRGGYYVAKPADRPLQSEFLLMRADTFLDVRFWHVRAAASVGYANEGSLGAALTREEEHNFVSREHWFGFELDSTGSWLVRGGRIALPFGIRTPEHNLWVRRSTRTDIDDDQQYGLAVAVSKGIVRAEVMGILGNYQTRPDDYRERGYSAYIEIAPLPGFAAGVSGLSTRARRDIEYEVSSYRHAYGAFARYSPIEPLIFIGEFDWTYQSLTWNGHRSGFAAYLQGDYEMLRGVHFMLTGESKNDGRPDEPPSFGGWISGAWFFAPHADFRIDNIFQTLKTPVAHQDVFSMLLQLHVYL